MCFEHERNDQFVVNPKGKKTACTEKSYAMILSSASSQAHAEHLWRGQVTTQIGMHAGSIRIAAGGAVCSMIRYFPLLRTFLVFITNTSGWYLVGTWCICWFYLRVPRRNDNGLRRTATRPGFDAPTQNFNDIT